SLDALMADYFPTTVQYKLRGIRPAWKRAQAIVQESRNRGTDFGRLRVWREPTRVAPNKSLYKQEMRQRGIGRGIPTRATVERQSRVLREESRRTTEALREVFSERPTRTASIPR